MVYILLFIVFSAHHSFGMSAQRKGVLKSVNVSKRANPFKKLEKPREDFKLSLKPAAGHMRTKKKQSWLRSSIVEPFNKAYKLYLKFADRKQYDALIASQQELFANEINDQALDAFNQMKDVINARKPVVKKGHFYQLTAHQALEGGALLAKDLALSSPLSETLINVHTYLVAQDYAHMPQDLLQAIYEMNSVLKEAKELMQTRGGFDKFAIYDADAIEVIILKEAANRKLKLTNEKPYSDYLTSWIRNTSNTKKAAVALGAIGGLYVFGYFLPENLKYYAQLPLNTIGSGIKKAVKYVADKTGLSDWRMKTLFEESLKKTRIDEQPLLESALYGHADILQSKHNQEYVRGLYSACMHEYSRLRDMLQNELDKSDALSNVGVYMGPYQRVVARLKLFEANPHFESIKSSYQVIEERKAKIAERLGIVYKGY